MAAAPHRYVLPVADEIAAEVAARALWAAGAVGLWERGTDRGAELVAYFVETTPAVPDGGRWEDEPATDWLVSWREGLEPVRVGSLLVTPSWHEAAAEPDAIRIDPQMAFGTGQHATTRLCLGAVEDLVRPDDRVLDVGTGTGLLAIAAIRLGAREAVALDTDPDAVEVARRNVAANLERPDRVVVREGSVPVDDDAFDLVVANLTTATVVRLAHDLSTTVRPGGRLVTSGIAEERADRVVDALRGEGLRVGTPRSAEGWVAITAERTPGAIPS